MIYHFILNIIELFISPSCMSFQFYLKKNAPLWNAVGGRPDLLVMKPVARAESDGPVGYPRCEWFYDNPTAHQSNTANSDEYDISL